MFRLNKRKLKYLAVLVSILFLATALTGVSYAKETRFFTVTLVTPIGNQAREKAGQVIARQLEKIGIGVNLRYMDFASLTPRADTLGRTGKTFDEGGMDMWIWQSSSNAAIEPTGLYSYFACEQQVPVGSNRTRYCNKEFDEYIYKGLATADDEERFKLAEKAQEILISDLPIIPLWYPAQFYGIRSSVEFPEERSPSYWETYAFQWAERSIEGKSKEEMSERERTLVYAQPAGVDHFLPGFMTSGYTYRAIERIAYDALIHDTRGSYHTGETLGPEPALAESWEIKEDGKKWTVHLREDVKWHDGEKFDADDVIFTYNELLKNPASGYGAEATARYYEDNGIEIEKEGKYTVVFTLNENIPTFPIRVLAEPILPKHLLKDVPVDELMTSELNQEKIVGTGAFVMEEYKPGESITYKANEDYYGGKPWFDHLTIKFIPKPATAFMALKKGEVDVTEKWYGFTREIQQIKEDPDMYYAMEESLGPQQILFNGDHPKLKNIWVRRAISLAIPREAFVEDLSAGLGRTANQLLHPNVAGHSNELPEMEYDLEKAKACMEKAGYDYDNIVREGPKKGVGVGTWPELGD